MSTSACLPTVARSLTPVGRSLPIPSLRYGVISPVGERRRDRAFRAEVAERSAGRAVALGLDPLGREAGVEQQPRGGLDEAVGAAGECRPAGRIDPAGGDHGGVEAAGVALPAGR